MALAPGLTVQPTFLPSPAGWPEAARGPRRPVVRASALWARAVAGERRGPWASRLQALLAGKRTLAVCTGSVGSAGSGALAATPPGRAALRSSRRAGGGAQGEETQGPRAHKTTSPGCFGQGRPSALRGATVQGGGAQSITLGGARPRSAEPGKTRAERARALTAGGRAETISRRPGRARGRARPATPAEGRALPSRGAPRRPATLSSWNGNAPRFLRFGSVVGDRRRCLPGVC